MLASLNPHPSALRSKFNISVNPPLEHDLHAPNNVTINWLLSIHESSLINIMSSRIAPVQQNSTQNK